ncbi:MAG: phosphoribosylformylglycinamidine synthase subunit PurL [Sphaerochaetaceae bacterium]
MEGTTRFDIQSMTDQQIEQLMGQLNVGLSVSEARDLQNRILGRSPTLAELILFGIEGSEHCSYKSSRPYLKLFPTDGADVIIGAKEDAGIVRICSDNQGNGYGVVVSHESHNHPSQLVPYEGAATGIGGNIRDVCCMGGSVIAVGGDFRFGNLDIPYNRYLADQVAEGVAGYANPTGVPVIAANVQFDPSYNDNCLVTAVTLGIVREKEIIHSYAPSNADGYDLILVGKSTDNSGFGGASFASFDISLADEHVNKGANQEPNAFLGRLLMRATDELVALLSAKGLIDQVACKDLGAGGIACATVELAEGGGYGAFVNVDLVHKASDEHPPYVILCSETQERYLWAAPKTITPLILDHFNSTFALSEVSHKAQATIIGHITNSTNYIVVSEGQVLIDAPASEITKGFLYHRPLGEPLAPQDDPVLPLPTDLKSVWLAILSHPNVASKEAIYNRFDRHVQGDVIQPLESAQAGIITPFNNQEFPQEIQQVGVTLSCSQNPRFNAIDAYQGAYLAVLHSFANTAASGAQAIAISDCLCYGNPENPVAMRQFADGAKGVADAATDLGVPVIAGNVSLYNESKDSAIVPSPMIAMIGKFDDVQTALPMQLQQAGSTLLLIGQIANECGGSIYWDLYDKRGSSLPQANASEMKKAAAAIAKLAATKKIASCRTIAEGGLATAVSLMAFGSEFGCALSTQETLRDDQYLFSESLGFIVEVEAEHLQTVQQVIEQAKLPYTHIGTTTAKQSITYKDIHIDLIEAQSLYNTALTTMLQ